jgi:hypothetical protein
MAKTFKTQLKERLIRELISAATLDESWALRDLRHTRDDMESQRDYSVDEVDGWIYSIARDKIEQFFGRSEGEQEMFLAAFIKSLVDIDKCMDEAAEKVLKSVKRTARVLPRGYR